MNTKLLTRLLAIPLSVLLLGASPQLDFSGQCVGISDGDTERGTPTGIYGVFCLRHWHFQTSRTYAESTDYSSRDQGYAKEYCTSCSPAIAPRRALPI